jgi:predicted dehydrogenase
LAVVGAGLIGRRHVDAIRLAGDGIALAAIADPDPAAKAFAEGLGVSCYGSLDALLAQMRPDGVILATPNQKHANGVVACAASGVPALVEKPFAADIASGETAVAAADKAGIALLTGHHRRHNPLIRVAKSEIEAGAIGTVVSVQATTWFYKPDDYFDVEWRKKPGAGPVYINLIHDIDLFHFLAGPIDSVHAMESNAVRRYAVGDTSVVVLRFASGALGTINLSDTIVAPWSWELTARENPAYPATDQACYLFGGTHGSLELPALKVWKNDEKRSWWEPISATHMLHGFDDPLILQIRQFAEVIRGEDEPLCSGHDGLAALRVIEAVKRSAATGQSVDLWPKESLSPSGDIS